jgi:AraC family transcriptional regulator
LNANPQLARATTDHAPGQPASRLDKALVFIDLNLGGTITLPVLAQVVGLSRMHFARLFRTLTGVSPHEYVRRRRLECAKDLLVHSDNAVAEIARASGFRTPAHFANVFRRFVGKPPSRWRCLMRATAGGIGN